tara:strand:+ start:3885 stop:4490 length:606 start_codon:yes stop_codon:yes gene_type:complete
MQDLPWLEEACSRCALPLETPHNTVCGSCQQYPPPFDMTHTLFHYHDPINQLVSDFKFQKKLVNGKLFSDLLGLKLASHYKTEKPDVIIPIPLHKTRLRERGFNQALELAKPIAKQLAIPLDYKSCVRVKATERQSDIPAKQRKGNVRNAFEVKDGFMPQYVAVVDDVITTGSTVKEFCKTLKQAGVERIDVWSVCRVSKN